MKALNIALAALLCGSLSANLYAEPPEGRGWKKHKKHGSYKEEYWDGNCKVERKWKRNGDYEEERKCKAPRNYGRHHHHHDHGTRVVILPPWFNQQAPEPEYRPEWRPAPQTTSARCNSQQVGNVLGGLIGGVLGHQIGGGSGKTIATIGGTIAGVLVGGKIGQQMDQRNQACVAQALEFAPEGQRITWQNQDSGMNYAVTPGAFEQRGDQYCRSFVTEANGQHTQDTACRRSDGTWAPAY